jgi:hypothetical protein
MNPRPVFSVMRRLRCVSTVLGLVVVASFPAMAQTAVDFSEGDGAFTRYDPFSPWSDSATFNTDGGVYQIQAVAPPDASTEYGPGRAGAVLTGVSLSNFSVSVDVVSWDSTLPQSFGIVARVSEFGLGTSDGYFFNYAPGSGRGRTFGEVEISRFDDEIRNTEALTAMQVTDDLSSGTGYRFVFEGVGSLLTGSIYELTDLSTPLITIQLADSTYLSGGVGLLVTDSSLSSSSGPVPADATFDNFTASAIPEPGTYAALAGLASGLTAFWFRRKRRAVGASAATAI